MEDTIHQIINDSTRIRNSLNACSINCRHLIAAANESDYVPIPTKMLKMIAMHLEYADGLLALVTQSIENDDVLIDVGGKS